MLALSAGLETLESVLDAVIHTLVIARLEVQAVLIRPRAPVAAVKRVGALEEMAQAIGLPDRFATFTISALGNVREISAKNSRVR